jgi:hypothetical protein
VWQTQFCLFPILLPTGRVFKGFCLKSEHRVFLKKKKNSFTEKNHKSNRYCWKKVQVSDQNCIFFPTTIFFKS